MRERGAMREAAIKISSPLLFDFLSGFRRQFQSGNGLFNSSFAKNPRVVNKGSPDFVLE
jgi:hypothetical protein